MAQLLQTGVSYSGTTNISTQLSIPSPNGVVVQNVSEEIVAYLSTDANFNPGTPVEPGGGNASCWVLRPGETTPKINLAAGESLYGAAPGATFNNRYAVIQVCTDV